MVISSNSEQAVANSSASPSSTPFRHPTIKLSSRVSSKVGSSPQSEMTRRLLCEHSCARITMHDKGVAEKRRVEPSKDRHSWGVFHVCDWRRQMCHNGDWQLQELHGDRSHHATHTPAHRHTRSHTRHAHTHTWRSSTTHAAHTRGWTIFQQHGLSSNNMALITSHYGIMRSLSSAWGLAGCSYTLPASHGRHQQSPRGCSCEHVFAYSACSGGCPQGLQL